MEKILRAWNKKMMERRNSEGALSFKKDLQVKTEPDLPPPFPCFYYACPSKGFRSLEEAVSHIRQAHLTDPEDQLNDVENENTRATPSKPVPPKLDPLLTKDSEQYNFELDLIDEFVQSEGVRDGMASLSLCSNSNPETSSSSYVDNERDEVSSVASTVSTDEDFTQVNCTIDTTKIPIGPPRKLL